MRNKLLFLLTLTLLLIASLSSAVVAQDDGPVVIGNSDAESLRVVKNFLNSFDTSLLSKDVQYSDTAWQKDYQGRANVETIYTDYYNGGVFTETSAQPERYIVAGNGQVVVAEYMLNAVNSGDYGPHNATNKNVSIPTVTIFRVEDGKITRISTYADQRVLYQQLDISSTDYVDPMTMSDDMAAGSEMTAEPGTDTSADTSQESGREVALDKVLDDPAAFYGERLTIEDELVNAINEHVFMLEDDDPLAPDQLLIVFDANNTANVDIFALEDQDRTVRVTGTLQQFHEGEFQNEYTDIDFSDERLDGWEDEPVLIISNLTVVPD